MDQKTGRKEGRKGEKDTIPNRLRCGSADYMPPSPLHPRSKIVRVTQQQVRGDYLWVSRASVRASVAVGEAVGEEGEAVPARVSPNGAARPGRGVLVYTSDADDIRL